MIELGSIEGSTGVYRFSMRLWCSEGYGFLNVLIRGLEFRTGTKGSLFGLIFLVVSGFESELGLQFAGQCLGSLARLVSV